MLGLHICGCEDCDSLLFSSSPHSTELMTAAPIMLWTGGWRDTGGCEWKKRDYSVESPNEIRFSFSLEQLYMVMSSSLNSMASNPFLKFPSEKCFYFGNHPHFECMHTKSYIVTISEQNGPVFTVHLSYWTVRWICCFEVELLLMNWTKMSDFCVDVDFFPIYDKKISNFNF